MSARIPAVLAERLYVPFAHVTRYMKDQYTYHFGDEDDLLPLEVTTYKEFDETIGFARGDIGKLHEVFGDTFSFDDQRAAVPFGYPFKFTGKLEPEQRETIRDWMARDYGMIKAPPRWGKCADGNALVFTADGLIPLSGLQHTPKLLSLHGVSSTSQWHDCGVQPVRKIRSYCGFELSGTYEHPVLILDKDTLDLYWLPLSEVVPKKHYVAIFRGFNYWSVRIPTFDFHFEPTHRTKTLNTTPVGMTHELARLLGYLVSEGCVAHSYTSFTNTDESLLDDFRACYLHCFGETLDLSLDHHGIPIYTITNAELTAYLTYVGLPRGKSKDKCVPWSILQSPVEYVATFIRAYMDGDGWHEKDKVCVSSASKTLLHQLQILLSNFGVISRVSSFSRKGPTSGILRSYCKLSIFGKNIARYNSLIGFTIERKRKFLSRHRKSDWTENIPGVYSAIHTFMLRHSSDGGWYTLSSGKRVQMGLGKRFARGKHGELPASYFEDNPNVLPNIRKLDSDLAAKLEFLRHLPVFWDQVVFNEKVGKAPVYDLTVPFGHSFVANAVCVHNTVVTIALLCKIKQRALVLAHEHSLLTDWEKELRKHTNIDELEEEHGIQLAGFLKKDLFPLITFCTYQRFIHPKGIKFLKKNRDSFGAVVIDEAHLCSAPCFSVVVSSINSFYRIPITATDKRKDNMHIISSDIAGPVTAIGRTEQLQVKIVYVPTGFKVREFKMWTTLINRLSRDIDRTQLIAENIVADVNRGRSVVVTTDRVAHVKQIHDFILDVDSDIVVEMVTSRTTAKQRDDIKTRAKTGEVQVVVAMNKIVQLGWNVPRWDTFHNTIPMSNEPNWYQRVSRIRTPFYRCPACGWEEVKCDESEDGAYKLCKECGKVVVPNKKKPLVRDYIDTGHGAIFATRAVRERVARKFGWEVTSRPDPNKAKTKPGQRAKDIMDL